MVMGEEQRMGQKVVRGTPLWEEMVDRAQGTATEHALRHEPLANHHCPRSQLAWTPLPRETHAPVLRSIN